MELLPGLITVILHAAGLVALLVGLPLYCGCLCFHYFYQSKAKWAAAPLAICLGVVLALAAYSAIKRQPPRQLVMTEMGLSAASEKLRDPDAAYRRNPMRSALLRCRQGILRQTA